MELQSFSDCRLAAGIGSSIAPCLLSQPVWNISLKKICALGKRAWRKGRNVLCCWKMDQEASPQWQPIHSSPCRRGDNLPSLSLAAEPNFLLSISPADTSLSVTACEWLEKAVSRLLLARLLPTCSLGLWATRQAMMVHIFTRPVELKDSAQGAEDQELFLLTTWNNFSIYSSCPLCK